MHELYLSPNGTTLQYTMTMPPTRLEHVQYMDIGSLQQL